LHCYGSAVSTFLWRASKGFKGSNQAVMAARLSAKVSVIVKLGKDVFGENYLKNYQEQGIDTSYVMVDDICFSGVAPIALSPATEDLA
jgi:ribokinase